MSDYDRTDSGASGDDDRSYEDGGSQDESQISVQDVRKKFEHVVVDPTMKKLIGDDEDQEFLHRVLKANENTETKKNLADHVQTVMDILIDSYPDQAYSKVEEVSACVKRGEDTMKAYLKLSDSRDYREVAKDLSAHTAKAMKLFPKKTGGDEEENTEEPASICNIDDLMSDSSVWQWAGIGFGQQETYCLQKSLQGLAKDVNPSFMRFFGKIRGIQTDYYIVEATVGDDGEGEGEGGDGGEDAKEPDMEDKGTGVNKYTYFVTENTFSSWKKLPNLAPRHI